jgi:molecular chaperone DnaK
MVEVFGMDLGTSSCSVARVIGGHAEVLPVFDGQYEMPTYVAFTPDEQKLVGWPAKRQSVMNPANTIFTIKRLIGRKFVSDATQADLGLPIVSFPLRREVFGSRRVGEVTHRRRSPR